MGRLMSGPNPFGISGRRVGLTFVGRLVLEPNPLEALGLGRLAGDAGPGPTVPTMLPLFLLGRKTSLGWKSKVDRHIMGNS